MEDINRIYLSQCGSAIGLGAMWKFPYMAGIYGGGAFTFILNIYYFVGLPLLIMEFTVGKMGRTYTTHIYSKLTGKKWLNIIGWNGNLAVFILFGFYSVIGGWISTLVMSSYKCYLLRKRH